MVAQARQSYAVSYDQLKEDTDVSIERERERDHNLVNLVMKLSNITVLSLLSVHYCTLH